MDESENYDYNLSNQFENAEEIEEVKAESIITTYDKFVDVTQEIEEILNTVNKRESSQSAFNFKTYLKNMYISFLTNIYSLLVLYFYLLVFF